MRINLGCGQDYMAGWQNWDISKEVKAEKYLDIRKDKFPAEDGSVDEIYCNCVLEQILENEQLIHVLNECHRVLKSKGKLVVGVPNSQYSITYQDPHDCRHFLPSTFNYFDYKKIHYQRFGKIYGYKPWDVVNVVTQSNKILIVKMVKHDS